MSDGYIQRLRLIRDEFIALRFALSFVNRNWNTLDIYVHSDETAYSHLAIAEMNLEKTYIIRLFSEFEGALHEHLLSAGNKVPQKPSAEWLISEVSRQHKSALHPRLIKKVREVQTYRNSLVHPRSQGASDMIFQDVLAHLNRYLSKL